MAKRFISYGSTLRFEGVLKIIRRSTPNLPTYKVQGFEKIHGQNFAVCYSNPDGIWYQSRNNIVEASPTAKYLKEEPWVEIINSLAKEYNVDLDTHIITVYGEHCGGNIQKLSAVSDLSKRFIIFADFKVSPLEARIWDKSGSMCCKDVESQTPSMLAETLNPEPVKWYPTEVNQVLEPHYTFGMPNIVNVSNELFDIYNIRDFPSVELEIDFSRPEEAITKIGEMVSNVEDNSGVAKYFGKEGNVGEGYVFSFYDLEGNRYHFKAKGEKHSANAGRVKPLKPIDEIKKQKRDFVNNYAMQGFRLNQAWEEVFGVNNEKNRPDIKFIGQVIQFILNDTFKEESDKLTELGLEDKDVKGLIANQTREWFLTRIRKEQQDE